MSRAAAVREEWLPSFLGESTKDNRRTFRFRRAMEIDSSSDGLGGRAVVRGGATGGTEVHGLLTHGRREGQSITCGATEQQRSQTD